MSATQRHPGLITLGWAAVFGAIGYLIGLIMYFLGWGRAGFITLFAGNILAIIFAVFGAIIRVVVSTPYKRELDTTPGRFSNEAQRINDEIHNAPPAVRDT